MFEEFKKLSRPDDVGTSEYRAIYEVLQDADPDLELARAILLQFIEEATSILQVI